MATVINEVTVEPKAMPPSETGPARSAGGGEGGKVAPDVQREIEKALRQSRERAARLYAH